ncbi:MAG: hypothetical protein ACI8WB_001050 [Phenylobacterium sp.]|jgi:hypothetical protein
MDLPLHKHNSIPSKCRDAKIIATGLVNPRGLQALDDGSILVIEAGRGEMKSPDTGRLLKLSSDISSDERKTSDIILDKQHSMNMLGMMNRDEIMGMSDIAQGDGQTLVSLTNYVAGSTVMRVSPGPVSTVFNSRGNLNSIVYHPQLKAWFGIKPDANVVVEFSATGDERIVAELADLADGQDAVPVCVIYEPSTGALLVSLFSGELGQDAAKKGIDFDKTAGQVIRVDATTGEVTPVVTGLTAPTGIELGDDGRLYVLELCDDFLEPLVGDNATAQCLHGGFKRFSGSLLQVDLSTGEMVVVANQLDTPSNLVKHDGHLLISEGMGMPGRPIPGLNGEVQPLAGFIRQVSL